MAGLGRKVFNSGDILLASEVQGYLQDQAVMVFDDSATRATAIGTANFSEGMVTYTKDNDQLEVYDGSTFKNFSGGLVHIETQTFSGVAAHSIDNVFDSTYDNYRVLARVVNSIDASNNVFIRMRAAGTDDSGSNYAFQRAQFDTSTVGVSRNTGLTNSSDMFFVDNSVQTPIVFEFYAPAQTRPTMISGFVYSIVSGLTIRVSAATNTTSTSFDGFTLLRNGSNLITGSVSVYGYAKA